MCFSIYRLSFVPALFGSDQPACAPVNKLAVNMPSGKTPRRIGIDHLNISCLWYAKILVLVPIQETHIQYAVFIVKIFNVRGSRSLDVSGFVFFKRFWRYAHQEMIGADNRFAFFFGSHALIVIAEFVRVAVFHAIAVNGFQFFERGGFGHIQQLAVLGYFFRAHGKRG